MGENDRVPCNEPVAYVMAEELISDSAFVRVSKRTYASLVELSKRKEKDISEVVEELARKETFRLHYKELMSHE